MKKFFSVLVLLLCLCAMPQFTWAADVYYGDQLVCQTEHIYDSVDGACVPVRQFFEALDYEVKWNAKYNLVTLHHPQRGNLLLRVGSREAKFLDYFDCQLPVAPYFHDDVLYAPLVLLKDEYLDYNLEWQPENKRWQINDKQPDSVQPFANLTREQLAGVTLHFGKENSHISIYTAELNEEEITKLLGMLQKLAYRAPAFTGEAIEFSGSYGTVFDLHYADGHTLEFGFAGPFYLFIAEHEEPKGYVAVDDCQQQDIKNFYKQLKDEYLAMQNN